MKRSLVSQWRAGWKKSSIFFATISKNAHINLILIKLKGFYLFLFFLFFFKLNLSLDCLNSRENIKSLFYKEVISKKKFYKYHINSKFFFSSIYINDLEFIMKKKKNLLIYQDINFWVYKNKISSNLLFLKDHSFFRVQFYSNNNSLHKNFYLNLNKNLILKNYSNLLNSFLKDSKFSFSAFSYFEEIRNVLLYFYFLKQEKEFFNNPFIKDLISCNSFNEPYLIIKNELIWPRTAFFCYQNFFNKYLDVKFMYDFLFSYEKEKQLYNVNLYKFYNPFNDFEIEKSSNYFFYEKDNTSYFEQTTVFDSVNKQIFNVLNKIFFFIIYRPYSPLLTRFYYHIYRIYKSKFLEIGDYFDNFGGFFSGIRQIINVIYFNSLFFPARFSFINELIKNNFSSNFYNYWARSKTIQNYFFDSFIEYYESDFNSYILKTILLNLYEEVALRFIFDLNRTPRKFISTSTINKMIDSDVFLLEFKSLFNISNIINLKDYRAGLNLLLTSGEYKLDKNQIKFQNKNLFSFFYDFYTLKTFVYIYNFFQFIISKIQNFNIFFEYYNSKQNLYNLIYFIRVNIFRHKNVKKKSVEELSQFIIMNKNDFKNQLQTRINSKIYNLLVFDLDSKIKFDKILFFDFVRLYDFIFRKYFQIYIFNFFYQITSKKNNDFFFARWVLSNRVKKYYKDYLKSFGSKVELELYNYIDSYFLKYLKIDIQQLIILISKYKEVNEESPVDDFLFNCIAFNSIIKNYFYKNLILFLRTPTEEIVSSKMVAEEVYIFGRRLVFGLDDFEYVRFNQDIVNLSKKFLNWYFYSEIEKIEKMNKISQSVSPEDKILKIFLEMNEYIGYKLISISKIPQEQDIPIFIQFLNFLQYYYSFYFENPFLFFKDSLFLFLKSLDGWYIFILEFNNINFKFFMFNIIFKLSKLNIFIIYNDFIDRFNYFYNEIFFEIIKIFCNFFIKFFLFTVEMSFFLLSKVFDFYLEIFFYFDIYFFDFIFYILDVNKFFILIQKFKFILSQINIFHIDSSYFFKFSIFSNFLKFFDYVDSYLFKFNYLIEKVLIDLKSSLLNFFKFYFQEIFIKEFKKISNFIEKSRRDHLERKFKIDKITIDNLISDVFRKYFFKKVFFIEETFLNLFSLFLFFIKKLIYFYFQEFFFIGSIIFNLINFLFDYFLYLDKIFFFIFNNFKIWFDIVFQLIYFFTENFLLFIYNLYLLTFHESIVEKIFSFYFYFLFSPIIRLFFKFIDYIDKWYKKNILIEIFNQKLLNWKIYYDLKIVSNDFFLFTVFTKIYKFITNQIFFNFIPYKISKKEASKFTDIANVLNPDSLLVYKFRQQIINFRIKEVLDYLIVLNKEHKDKPLSYYEFKKIKRIKKKVELHQKQMIHIKKLLQERFKGLSEEKMNKQIKFVSQYEKMLEESEILEKTKFNSISANSLRIIADKLKGNSNYQYFFNIRPLEYYIKKKGRKVVNAPVMFWRSVFRYELAHIRARWVKRELLNKLYNLRIPVPLSNKYNISSLNLRGNEFDISNTVYTRFIKNFKQKKIYKLSKYQKMFDSRAHSVQFLENKYHITERNNATFYFISFLHPNAAVAVKKDPPEFKTGHNFSIFRNIELYTQIQKGRLKKIDTLKGLTLPYEFRILSHQTRLLKGSSVLLPVEKRLGNNSLIVEKDNLMKKFMNDIFLKKLNPFNIQFFKSKNTSFNIFQQALIDYQLTRHGFKHKILNAPIRKNTSLFESFLLQKNFLEKIDYLENTYHSFFFRLYVLLEGDVLKNFLIFILFIFDSDGFSFFDELLIGLFIALPIILFLPGVDEITQPDYRNMRSQIESDLEWAHREDPNWNRPVPLTIALLSIICLPFGIDLIFNTQLLIARKKLDSFEYAYEQYRKSQDYQNFLRNNDPFFMECDFDSNHSKNFFLSVYENIFEDIQKELQFDVELSSLLKEINELRVEYCRQSSDKNVELSLILELSSKELSYRKLEYLKTVNLLEEKNFFLLAGFSDEEILKIKNGFPKNHYYPSLHTIRRS